MQPLPYTFKHQQLLQLALTVPSAEQSKKADNQRLEFLGDAVLQLLVSERLFRRHPQLDEGGLTILRKNLVSGKALLARAGAFCGGMRKRLEEANPKVTFKDKAIADAIEALFGAAWEDGGRPAAECLLAALYDASDFELAGGIVYDAENPKGELQHLGQKHYKEDPTYVELERFGVCHEPTFRCAVTLHNCVAEGEGCSRKRAEKAAAQAWLRQYK